MILERRPSLSIIATPPLIVARAMFPSSSRQALYILFCTKNSSASVSNVENVLPSYKKRPSAFVVIRMLLPARSILKTPVAANLSPSGISVNESPDTFNNPTPSFLVNMSSLILYNLNELTESITVILFSNHLKILSRVLK